MAGDLSQARGKASTLRVAWPPHCREGCLPRPYPALPGHVPLTLPGLQLLCSGPQLLSTPEPPGLARAGVPRSPSSPFH